jgi:hypothetical protein
MLVLLGLTVSWVTTGFSDDGPTWVSLGPETSDMLLKSDPNASCGGRTKRIRCIVSPLGQPATFSRKPGGMEPGRFGRTMDIYKASLSIQKNSL